MKKVIITLALAAFVLAGNAQILKNDLLKGYKEGDKLEKSVYNEKTAPIAMNTWCGAFSSKPNTNPSPTIGKELTRGICGKRSVHQYRRLSCRYERSAFQHLFHD